MVDLVRYERARQEIAECARIDEAAELRDKAAAIAAYARQRNDTELEVWFSEIKLRASIRIGELVRDLETAEREGSPGTYRLPTDGKSKADAIAEAGLSKTDAYRCQELAGSKTEIGSKAGHAAAEAHFAQARAEKRPATVESLRGAIKAAIVSTLGPVPDRPPAVPRAPVDHTWTDFYAAIRPLAEGGVEQFDPVKLADAGMPSLRDRYLELAHGAADVIGFYIAEMEGRAYAQVG